MRRLLLAGGQSDERLDAAFEAQRRDEHPEPPMTDEDIERMYRYFHPEEPTNG